MGAASSHNKRLHDTAIQIDEFLFRESPDRPPSAPFW
jgi:hypothetical protein